MEMPTMFTPHLVNIYFIKNQINLIHVAIVTLRFAVILTSYWKNIFAIMVKLFWSISELGYYDHCFNPIHGFNKHKNDNKLIKKRVRCEPKENDNSITVSVRNKGEDGDSGDGWYFYPITHWFNLNQIEVCLNFFVQLVIRQVRIVVPPSSGRSITSRSLSQYLLTRNHD
jgi:hypothetical protein